MKKYLKPEIEITEINNLNDIITASTAQDPSNTQSFTIDYSDLSDPFASYLY